MKTILFIPSIQSHVINFIPVLNFIEQSDNYNYMILLLPLRYKAMKSLDDHGLKYTSLLPYIITHEEFTSYHPLKKYIITRRTLNRVKSTIKEYLKKVQPDLIVVGNDCIDFEYLTIKLAEELNIPSLILIDGVINDEFFKRENFKFHVRVLQILKDFIRLAIAIATNSLYKKIKIYKDIPYGTASGSYIAASGPKPLQFFVERGVSSDKIMVTGFPKFDILVNNLNNISDIRKKYSIKKNQHVVSVALSPLYLFGIETIRDRYDTIRSIEEIKSHFPEYKIYIKLHPTENLEKQRNDLSDLLSESFLIEQDINIYELIVLSDFLITNTSTVGLEAIVLSRPMISINLTNYPFHNIYLEEKTAFKVTSYEELISAIESIKADDDRMKEIRTNMDRFISNYCYKIDGKSSDRVVSFINQIINETN